MALYRGNNPLKPYLGDGRPLNVYLGPNKLAGWTLQSHSGASLDVTGTYEDAADVTVSGNTVVHNGAFSSVEGKTLTCRAADGSRSSSVAMPTLRKVGTVADTYVPATGSYTKAISDVVDVVSNALLGARQPGYRVMWMRPSDIANVDNFGHTIIKYDGTQLVNVAAHASGNLSPDETYRELGGSVDFTVGVSDSGWSDALTPTPAEIKAYFYGWRMCNADGSSPYTGGTKNWQHVTDGKGQTATLPTASYAGYTPYKLLYQLATPVTTTQEAKVMPTYRDETVIETDADTWCQPTISASVKVMS